MNKSLRVVLWVTGILLLLLLVGNYVAKLQLKKSLEKIKAEEAFTYEDASVNLLFGKAALSQVFFENEALKLKAGEARLVGFSYFDYVFAETLELGNITLVEPNVMLKSKSKSETADDTIKKQRKSLDKVLNVNAFKIENGYLEILKDSANKQLSLKINNLELEDIVLSNVTLRQSIPFEYKSISASLDSIELVLNAYHDIAIEDIAIDRNVMNLTDLRILPRYGRADFQDVIPYEKDIITLHVPDMTLREFKLGNHKERLLFQAKALTLSQANCNIYRDKNKRDDTRIKPLYSEALRELGFGLVVESIDIDDAKLVYEEVVAGTSEPGVLEFPRLNASIKNLNNVSLTQEELPITTVDIKTGFMDSATLDVFWQFNVSNPADYFMMKGTGRNISASDMNHFFVPAINVRAVGVLNEVSFDYSGNRDEANGFMQMKYDKFKVEVLRKDGKHKNRFLSAVANLFLDNVEKDGLVKKDDISATRDKTKSFWNYFWLFVRNGALESLTSRS